MAAEPVSPIIHGVIMLNLSLIALYVGPDQLLPLTSILGAIGGALMIFWRQVVGFMKRLGGMIKRS